MNEIQTKRKLSDKMRWVLTLILGMLVLFWRIIIPSSVEITITIGTLMLGLDLCLTIVLILINKNQLKEAFIKKFTWKTFLLIILTFVILFVVSIIVFIMLTIFGIEPSAPAQVIGKEFSRIFPLGAAASMIINAPIWEEIAFRMAGRSLIKNNFFICNYNIVVVCLYSYSQLLYSR